MVHHPGDSVAPDYSRHPGSCLPFPPSDSTYSHVPGTVLESGYISKYKKAKVPRFERLHLSIQLASLHPLARNFSSKPSVYCQILDLAATSKDLPPERGCYQGGQGHSDGTCARPPRRLWAGQQTSSSPVRRCLWSSQLWSAIHSQACGCGRCLQLSKLSRPFLVLPCLCVLGTGLF